MIFIGGGGGLGLFVLAFFVLLLVGGGDAFPLLFLLMFFGLPFLVLRSFLRTARRAVPVGDWQTTATTWPPRAPQPPRQVGGWQPAPEPLLPRVSAADVGSLRDRLGHDVRSLEPGTDAVARQAMADASERYATASALLDRATTDAQLRTAWLAAVEGLHATRVARQRLGLDAGPPVPALPGAGPQLDRPARLEVDGRAYTGGPLYEPGRPHWFPGGSYGGRHVPGGWYDTPFWPGSLVLGGLAGFALGGLVAGAVFGDDAAYGDAGLGGGFEDSGGGFEDSGGGLEDAGGDFGGYGGGGDWGGGGGGDWGGGGGGDWGGGDGGDW